MTFYKENIYPFLVDMFGDPPPIKVIRQRIIPFAQGKVLEIGAGSGANFPEYDSRRVSKLYALEPNPGMIRLAKRRKSRTKLNIEFLDLPGEQIPLEDETIDTVVSTFTLCTIANLVEAMKGVARVLRPDGQLIFFELGLAPEAGVRRWQERLEPICRWLFQGLYLTRDIPSIIRRARFQINKMESGYIAQFPKSLSYCWWGAATKLNTE
jgi:ubiquinone/menaquinone biosynthesis C-methylase UbiE